MDDELRQRLTSKHLWSRALYMVLFVVAYVVAETLITLAAIFQFLSVLITGSANSPLLKFGLNLSTYIYQIVRFQTFNTEEKPFPFSDWPAGEPDENRWLVDADSEAESDMQSDSVEPADTTQTDDETFSNKPD